MSKGFSRTLIIGLGGTGQTVIRDIKKRLLRRYGEIPRLVKFLSFDTDADDYQDTPFQYYYDGENRKTQKYNLQQEEFVKISRPGLDVLRDDANCAHLNFQELEKIYRLWEDLYYGYHIPDFRVFGRASFLYNASSIMQRLRTTVADLKGAQLAGDQQASGYQLSNQNVSVYIIASLAGGTGSSAFLDMSRMLQHAGINVVPVAAGTPTDKIFGMFFMPAFFSTKPNTPNAKINTYVALSELDYVLGLSDRTKYPEGCSELKQDLNVYGDAQSYMPVRYSNVYLIDEKTRKGNSHSFEEASGYVASFIAASIAADNQALDSSYSNSTHRLHTVDGKSQIYSGLGYCEIRLERQNLVKYLLNRQIRDFLRTYKSDRSTGMVMDNLIESFLEKNLCKVDDLVNSIFQLHDERFQIPLHDVGIGKKAGIHLENSKKNYLDTISAEAEMAIKEFSLRKNHILTTFDLMLDDCRCKKGFGGFPTFAKRLNALFENIKQDLEDEVIRLKQTKEMMERRLEEDLNQIRIKASSLFLFTSRKKDALKSLIKAFSDKLGGADARSEPTLKTILLVIARNEEAIRVYDDLIRIINTYYKEEDIEFCTDKKAVQITGRWQELQAKYNALQELVESEIKAYTFTKVAKNGTIFADAFFKEYSESHPAFDFSEFAAIDLAEYTRKCLSSNEPINIETVSGFREFLLTLLPEEALVKKIMNYKMSLDALFIDCFGKADAIKNPRDLAPYPQLDLFKQLDELFDPLWQYDDFEDTHSQPVIRHCVVGVFDVQNHLFDSKNGYRQFIPRDLRYQFINVGDPDKIVFMLQETAIPAFKMSDATVWAGEFKAKKGETYSFSDERLEDIDMIMPEKGNETAEIAWAYGWMFGFIASVSGKIRVRPTTYYMTKNLAVMGNDGYYNYFGIHSQRASDLSACHRKFLKDEELATDIYNQVMKRLDDDKIGSIVRIAHWVNDELIWKNRVKPKSSMTEQERIIIQNEPLFLALRFDRLISSCITVKFEEGKVSYTDELGVLTSAEEAFQKSLTGD